jgi:hypothetical protein
VVAGCMTIIINGNNMAIILVIGAIFHAYKVKRMFSDLQKKFLQSKIIIILAAFLQIDKVN